jgi:hypothetical protein
MQPSPKLKEILQKNAEFEKESPYNYCDRWCERCVHEKQIRCTLYKDELERKITCIAHGRDEDDLEITEAVMEAQFKEVDERLSEHMDKYGIDLDNPDIDGDELDEEDAIDFDDLPPDIQDQIKFVENNPLAVTAEQYRKKAQDFLEGTFYKEKEKYLALAYDFETVAWYHTLLVVKLHRALCGFHESACEGEFALYDAIAQFQVCKKAITLSVEALRKIDTYLKTCHAQIAELIALLHNIHSRIVAMEESV